MKADQEVCVTVGVAGHLDLANQETHISAVVRDILTQIKTCLTSEPACFRLVTSLAAGADQLAAELACELGYSLQVVLPARCADFQKDIAKNKPANATIDPVAKFKELLAKKESLYELDGELNATKAKAREAYAGAARFVLAHSDVLIVILSRVAKERRGGTLWLARRAAKNGTPVIMIPVEEPEQVEISYIQRADGTL